MSSLPSEELQAAANKIHAASAGGVTLNAEGAAALATLLAKNAYYAAEYEGARPRGHQVAYDSGVLNALALAREIIGR